MSLKPEDVVLYQRTVFNMTPQKIDDLQAERIDFVRMSAKKLVGVIYTNSPEKSRERALALSKLEESLMWAVASIAREGWDSE